MRIRYFSAEQALWLVNRNIASRHLDLSYRVAYRR